MTNKHQTDSTEQATDALRKSEESVNEDTDTAGEDVKKDVLKADYDSPWKESLEDFEEFILFYVPELYDFIDWTKQPEFLDKEFQQIAGDATTGRRYADKLVRVWTTDGDPLHVLNHIEIQGARETNFEERMYIYHYRIYDKYRIPVVSIAILTDDDPSWKPTIYKTEQWGCRVEFEFLTKKLLDYKSKWAELEKNPNPFAVVTMANLKTMDTRDDHEERLRWKVWMVRELYKRGIKDEKIVRLVRLVDWMMALPKPLQEKFEIEWDTIEEEHNMMYMMDIERKGYDRGIIDGVKQGIELVEQERQAAIEKVLETRRQTILQLLHHRFEIEEYLDLTIQIRLQTIEDEDELKQLINHVMDITEAVHIFDHMPVKNES
ncbi:MAG: hypothetical protein AAF639_39420 [Chloroflexota bacterium]